MFSIPKTAINNFMSSIRFNLDLSIPEPLPKELEERLFEIQETLKFLQSFSSEINQEGINKEVTTRAVYHRCFHDEGKPCEQPKDISDENASLSAMVAEVKE